jgi:hypothetical protein
MDDFHTLFAIVACLYLSECVVWHAEGCYLLFGRPPQCRARHRPVLVLNGGGISFLNPLPVGGYFRANGVNRDLPQAAKRVEQWNEVAPVLRSACNLLLATILGGGALLLALNLLDRLALVWIVTIITSWVVVAGLSVWTTQRLFGGTFTSSITRCGMLFVSPFAAIRAMDRVTAVLLLDYHPLVAAYLLCTPKEFNRIARQLVFTPADCDEGDASAAAVAAEIVASTSGPNALAEAPVAEPGAVAYCPRCLMQYVTRVPHCVDCDGISLLRLRARSRRPLRPHRLKLRSRHL